MPLDRRVRVIVSCVISFKAQLWGKGGGADLDCCVPSTCNTEAAAVA